MTLPLPFDTQGFPVVNAIEWGAGGGPGGGGLSGLPWGSTAARAPTAIADNLVHEITNAGGAGMVMGTRYCVTQIGGDDIQVMEAAAAPAVATCRQSPYHLYSGVPWTFSPRAAGNRLWGVKAVDGTANANTYCDSPDGGTGA